MVNATQKKRDEQQIASLRAKIGDDRKKLRDIRPVLEKCKRNIEEVIRHLEEKPERKQDHRWVNRRRRAEDALLYWSDIKESLHENIYRRESTIETLKNKN